ncbi:uncharacterized protein LOC117578740 [Drosophila guanche]|uniref:Uncharacterized protein n=1 Tax=Drosophila guanche TaxID=7266 RepID=A0A3B0JW72_DROGU|nr:uncharacterized protein LOC117578740 [Drosophila guanche]SPP75318.1 Hypothetical predicted protein [Drosophila guanche]
MFAATLLQRKLSLALPIAFRPVPQMNYNETKAPNFYMWGGGLGKLQGGLKEEEYFTTVNQDLIEKMRDKKAIAEYLPNWDEYNKAINNAALYTTALMNKHKNVREEAFFMSETADNFKKLQGRNQKEETTVEDVDAAGNMLDQLK